VAVFVPVFTNVPWALLDGAVNVTGELNSGFPLLSVTVIWKRSGNLRPVPMD
jgi:hypothetical protein